MGVSPRQVLDMVEQVGACGGRAGPLVAVLEDELADLGDEGDVSVGWAGAQTSSEQRISGCLEGGHGRLGRQIPSSFLQPTTSSWVL